MDYVKESIRVHELNKTWWPHPQDLDTKVLLIISEITEAMEGERKDLMDDKLPHRKMAEVEMADTVIRALDLYGGRVNETVPPLKHFATDGFMIQRYQENTGNELAEITENWGTNRQRALLDIVKTACAISNHLFSSDCLLVVALCETYCRLFDYDLWGAYEEKLAYNQQREDHKIENRNAEGGKKF